MGAHWLLVTAQLLLAVAFLMLVYVYVDVQRRKKRFEAQGLFVVSQLFHYASLFVGLFPKSGWGLWVFPLRFGMEEEYSRLFKIHNVKIFAFVSFNYQEVFIK